MNRQVNVTDMLSKSRDESEAAILQFIFDSELCKSWTIEEAKRAARRISDTADIAYLPFVTVAKRVQDDQEAQVKERD